MLKKLSKRVVVGGGVVLLGILIAAGVGIYSVWQSNYNAPRPKLGEISQADKEVFQQKLDALEKTPEPGADATPEARYLYHYKKASALTVLGRYDEAIAEYKKAAESGYAFKYTYYTELGLAYEMKQDFANARKYYNEAIKKVEASHELTDEQKRTIITNIKNVNLQRVR